MSRIFAAHLDDERSQRAHPFWYRFGGEFAGALYFTFKKIEDVPKTCDCGNDFWIPPNQPGLQADLKESAETVLVKEFFE